MKSPRQVRSDIRTLTSHINQVCAALRQKSGVTIAQIGKECARTADALDQLLRAQQLPENYKVAVVGRFKTGKSSFVNELLCARLAGEDTNPETAAITTFRHGPNVRAIVRFLAEEEWVKLQALYAEDPKHIDAHRVKMWNNFNKPRKGKEGEDEYFDLAGLEQDFLKPGGHRLEITLAAGGSKREEAEFRRRLKDFTSGSKPHHCLVESIEIESPAEILDEGVLLIDTPGLDDTERFRVGLTEKTVEDVDAILYLTKSGESYGQSDKDFLLSLLRKGTVKQLIVVITQVDVTYQQHLDNAESNDDNPEPLSRRIERERRRLANELAATLAELSQDDSPAMRRYREQLGEVEVAFTSTKLHRSGKDGKPIPCAIDPADPGGIDRFKTQLLRLLSTESRIALAAQHIAIGARTALLDLQFVLDTKLRAIRDIKDREVAEQKLRSFREQFGQASQRFEGALCEQVSLLGKRLASRRKQHGVLVENIGLLAERELAKDETNDVALHWKTRRSGRWGHMRDLQGRVANRIFPKVQEMLGEHTEQFARFASGFEAHLHSLATEGAGISESLELGTSLPFDVTARLTASLERSMQRAQDLIAAEEQRVISMLDDFVSDEVSERIVEARDSVSDIWGRGTTSLQSDEVRDFYGEVRRLLAEALTNHLGQRSEAFGEFLMEEAKAAPRDALDEVRILLEQASDNIRAAAEALVAGQRETIESLVATIKADQQLVLAGAEAILEPPAGDTERSSKLGDLPAAVAMPSMPVVRSEVMAARSLLEDVEVADLPHLSASPEDVAPEAGATEDDWASGVESGATIALCRMRLRDQDSGWPIEKVFPPEYLHGATRARLVDPHLSKPHQLRNLKECLLHLAEGARPKEIEIVTGYAPEEFTAAQERFVDLAAKDLFKSFGVTLSLKRETILHDRCLILDHGVLFKLGRGLDIYKPTVALAEHRPGSRRVRQTDIDVFCWPKHALATGAASAS